MHLYLIRHGQSYVNLPDFDRKNWDRGLTELGHQQAGRVAAWLKQHVQADALYASTMLRAAETAAHIHDATVLPLTPDDRLREIGSCWDNASPIDLESITPEYPDFWASKLPFIPLFERGESWLDFLKRVGWFVAEALARHDDETVLVVCHGGVINAIMDIVYNVGPLRQVDVWNHNTGITHWEHVPQDGRQESWRLHAFNMVYHLVGENGAPSDV